MKDESKNVGGPAAGDTDTLGMPAVVDRATYQAELDQLRVREKAHTREGDAIAAARRRLPMVEVDSTIAFQVRSGLIIITGPPTGSSARGEVDAASFRTGLPARDMEVRSKTVPDADHFPVIRFHSAGLHRSGSVRLGRPWGPDWAASGVPATHPPRASGGGIP